MRQVSSSTVKRAQPSIHSKTKSFVNPRFAIYYVLNFFKQPAHLIIVQVEYGGMEEVLFNLWSITNDSAHKWYGPSRLICILLAPLLCAAVGNISS